MMGLIKKDLYMLKNNYKSLVVTFIIYITYSFMFDMNMSFLFPFMIFMLCLSTFSYDDFNNWDSFAITFPKGRTNIVKSKFITTVVLVIIANLIGFGMELIIATVKNNSINIKDTLSTTFGILVALSLMASILYPIIFKFGNEKGRIAMIIVGLAIGGLALLFTKYIKLDIPVDLIQTVEKFLPFICIAASALFISISYFISKKIYSKREF